MKTLAAILAVFFLALPAALADEYLPISTQEVATSATLATAPVAVGAFVTHVRFVMSATGYVAFTSSPFAAASSNAVFMPANVPEIFRVPPGSVIGVRLKSGTGTLYINDLSK